MSIIQPFLLPTVVPCGLVYIVARTSRHILDVIALTHVLRGTSPSERPAILREFGPWLARTPVCQVTQRPDLAVVSQAIRQGICSGRLMSSREKLLDVGARRASRRPDHPDAA